MVKALLLLLASVVLAIADYLKPVARWLQSLSGANASASRSSAKATPLAPMNGHKAGNGQSVIVLGAGVGGLSAAHELVKHGFRVTVYERNTEAGGIARSATEADGEHNEVTWHAVGGGYNHLIKMMGEIPEADGKGTVQEHLIPTGTVMYGRTGEQTFADAGNSFLTGGLRHFFEARRKMGVSRITLRDITKMGAILGLAHVAHPKRLEGYDKMTWEALIADLSDEAKKWASTVLGTFTGMDPRKVSAQCYFHLARSEILAEFPKVCKTPSGDPIVFYHLDGPMNRTWFNPWVRHLRSLGVEIHLASPVAEIRCSGGQVDGVLLESGETVRADHYVTALDPAALAKVLKGSSELQSRMAALDKQSRVLQMQVTFTFDEKFIYTGGATVIALPESPWGLLVRIEGSYWRAPMSLGAGKTREVLAAAFAVPDAPGILYGKPAHDCTRDEVVAEVWAQLKQARGAMRSFRTDDGLSLDDVKYTSARIWHSFQWDPVRARMDTYEPKFSNNVGTLALRPWTVEPALRNLVHSSAYVRTDCNTHHMESATEAGVRAANMIATGRPVPLFERYPEPTGIRGMLRKFDSALLARGYKHPLEWLL